MNAILSFPKWLFPCGLALVFPFAAMDACGSALPAGFAEFEKSAADGAAPPAGLSAPLHAMWLAKAGKWDDAHEIAQDIDTPTGSWIHAFLHREEGDRANANYWYRRAGMTMPAGFSIAEEWSFIARQLWRREHGITPGLEAVTSASGLVALSVKPARAEEGAWDTLIRDKDGKEILRVANARPVSFGPDGEILLLAEAAPDDDCRHFLIRAAAGAKVPPFGERKRIGGRFVVQHEWLEKGRTIKLSPDPAAGAGEPETVIVADHLSS